MEKNSDPECDGNEFLEGISADSLGAAPLMMTADEIATCLGISSRTVRRLKAKKDPPKAVKIGRAVRCRKSDILQWIEEGCPASHSLLNQLMYQVVWQPSCTLIGRLYPWRPSLQARSRQREAACRLVHFV